MASSLAKPLHPVAGKPMVSHVLDAAASIDPVATVLVVSPDLHDLPQRIGAGPGVIAAVQDPPLGTGDAVRQALPATTGAAWLLVFFADHPRLDSATVQALLAGARDSRALVTVLTALLPDPAGYGRIDRDELGHVRRIVERKDDDPALRSGMVEINSGMMAIDARWAEQVLPALTPSPATGEYYLTELVEIACADGPRPDGTWPVATVTADARVALGINDRVELAAADADLRQRIRERHMRDGVTIVGPETVFIDDGVSIGADTTILPFTVITGSTTIGTGCEIGPHAVLRDATIGDGVRVTATVVTRSSLADHSDAGPWSHVRGGSEIGEHAHVGNFAELKNTRLGAGAKSGHVSYLGDAEIGAGANIGAGTITANWDGVDKHRTVIGTDAFIGSDTILRAPVTVGDRARTGAGSVVTHDVPPGVTVVGVPARPAGDSRKAGE
jgi:bifunctional UDP-N-acetylglucosamine pyrophosphorylase / glucosamine-1-phosphate N-acetyltransferase